MAAALGEKRGARKRCLGVSGRASSRRANEQAPAEVEEDDDECAVVAAVARPVLVQCLSVHPASASDGASSASPRVAEEVRVLDNLLPGHLGRAVATSGDPWEGLERKARKGCGGGAWVTWCARISSS